MIDKLKDFMGPIIMGQKWYTRPVEVDRTKFYIRFDQKSVEWTGLVAYLKLNNNESQLCRIPAPKEILNSCLLKIDRKYPKLVKGYASVEARWYNSGVIYMTFEAREGDRGDEDGFGMDDGDYLTAIVNEHGNYILPFSDWQSYDAQWKALEYGITPILCNYSILSEFQKKYGKNNKEY